MPRPLLRLPLAALTIGLLALTAIAPAAGAEAPYRLRAITLTPGRTVTLDMPPAATLGLVISQISPGEASHAYHLAVAPYQPPAASPTPSPPPGSSPTGGTPLPKPTDHHRPASWHPRHTPVTLGQTDVFWIDHFDPTARPEHTRIPIKAALRLMSDHAYYYVEDGVSVSPFGLAWLAHDFEQAIYPGDTAVCGEPAVPGPDGDKRVSFVFTPLNSLGGYFDSPSLLEPPLATSNRSLVIALSSTTLHENPMGLMGAVAHEYTHLLAHLRKDRRLRGKSEPSWLAEGLAEYAKDQSGFGLSAGNYGSMVWANGYLAHAQAFSLTKNYTYTGDAPFAYGGYYLFLRYLSDRFGPGVIGEILDSDEVGVACVDRVLARHGSSFANAFSEWSVANLALPELHGTPDSYRTIDLRRRTRYLRGRPVKLAVATAPEITGSLLPWASAYHAFVAQTPHPWHVTLSAPDGGRFEVQAIETPGGSLERSSPPVAPAAHSRGRPWDPRPFAISGMGTPVR